MGDLEFKLELNCLSSMGVKMANGFLGVGNNVFNCGKILFFYPPKLVIGRIMIRQTILLGYYNRTTTA